MLGEKIKKLRLEKNMTITQLAQKANIAKSYVSSIERNIKINPSIQILEKIAEVLDVSISHLLNETYHSKTIDDDWEIIINKAIELGFTKEQFRKEILSIKKR